MTNIPPTTKWGKFYGAIAEEFPVRGLIKWFKKDVPWSRIPLFILGGILCNFAASITGLLLVKVLGLSPQAVDTVSKMIRSLTVEGVLIMFFVGAFYEELCFRLPLSIVVLFGTPGLAIFAALVSSVLFGFAHGGFAHVFIQGLGGLVLATIFLKCGGMQGKPIKALTASFSAHFGLNSVVFLLTR